MKKIIKNTSIALLVVFVGSTSFYIPLKSNNISPRQAAHEAAGTIATGANSLSNLIALAANESANLLAAAAGSTQSIRSSLGLNGKALNIFNIEPLSYIKLQAPIFDLLPLFFSTSTKIAPVKAPAQFTQPLSQSLNQTSAPITTNVIKKESKPEDAEVNIFCSQKIVVNGKVSSQRRTITGSGTLIHKDGTVLTNAHVGQFPLLSEKNPNIVCLARYGNPAKGSLSVKATYISPEWVKEYGKHINTEGVAQTGKSDFALLKIGLPGSDSLENISLSPITIQESIPNLNDTIYSISYPADILGIKGVTANLPQQKEKLSVGRFYSVGAVTNDVLETSPSSFAGQRGSSGGALVDQQGHLVGMITTVVNSTTPSKTLIRAMTIPHIDFELSKFSNRSLAQVARNGSSEVALSFNLQYRDYLTSLLNDYLK